MKQSQLHNTYGSCCDDSSFSFAVALQRHMLIIHCNESTRITQPNKIQSGYSPLDSSRIVGRVESSLAYKLAERLSLPDGVDFVALSYV